MFLTGTRADYGKMKSLMMAMEEHKDFECYIFVTGMHTLNEFGNTKNEIYKDNFKNIHVYMNQIIEEPMDLVLANTINGFSRYIRELDPDMIVVHGDRVEALAGAACGAINNILVAHIEGGEVSGTIDESIRHSISKLSHIHFVSNEDAKSRLLQLGESEESIYVIGSSDIDVILNKSGDNIKNIKKRYEIEFEKYAVLIYHPVTTEIDKLKYNIEQVVQGIIKSEENFIVVNPNNDTGYKMILNEYERFNGLENINRFPSIRFEYFIEILRNAEYIIGNSSAGIHEAPVLGLPTINLGNRQDGRFLYETIINCNEDVNEILSAIGKLKLGGKIKPTNHFGNGNSKKNFIEIMESNEVWKISKQKRFTDIKTKGDRFYV